MPNAQELWTRTERLAATGRDRTDRIMRDLELISLKDTRRRANKANAVINMPATLFWLAVGILSNRRPADRLHVGGQGKAALALAGKAERGLEGLWALRDRDELWDGGEEWRRTVAFWVALGHYYVTMWLDQYPDGSPKPISDVLSPLEAFHRPGSDGKGPVEFAWIRKVTAAEITDHAAAVSGGQVPSLKAGDALVLADYWWRDAAGVWYCIMTEGMRGPEFILAPEVTGRAKIPVLAGAAAGRPTRGFSTDRAVPIEAGQSVVELNRPVYEFLNLIATTYLRVARLYQRAPYLAVGLGLNVKPEDINRGEEFDIERAVIPTSNPNARITRVDPGPEPFSLRDLFNMGRSLAEEGGLARAFFGVLDTEPGGFAISQMLTQASHKLLPYMNRINFIRAAVATAWLEEFRGREMAPMLVRRQGVSSGVAEVWKPSDVPDRFLVDSQQPLALPSDMAQRVTLARQVNPQGPVMSRRMMQEQILGDVVRDPNLDDEWLEEDRLREHPMVVTINLIAEIRAKAAELAKIPGHQDEVADLERAVEVLRASFEQLVAQAGGGPARRAGVGNETLPSEMQQAGMSEDGARALMRQAQGRRNNLA